MREQTTQNNRLVNIRYIQRNTNPIHPFVFPMTRTKEGVTLFGRQHTQTETHRPGPSPASTHQRRRPRRIFHTVAASWAYVHMFLYLAVAAVALLATPTLGSSDVSVQATGVARSCKTGMDAFCKCRGNLEKKNPKLCKDIVKQCRKSFCRPLCLRMAWTTRIQIHCELAPEWTECRAFREQVIKAEEAIQTHFQAHVCSAREMGCCHNETKLLNHVENRHYADTYPVGKLPVAMCRTYEERDAHDILGLEHRFAKKNHRVSVEDLLARDKTEKENKKSNHTRAQLCDLCERVIHTEVITNEDTTCIPPRSTLKKVMPNSLHERCLFMADMVGNMKERLAHELRENVCSCVGCCDGGCYYSRAEHKPWLMDLVEKLTKKHTKDKMFL